MTPWLPPEWAPQAAVMLTWPRPDGDFARVFDVVERNFVAIAQAITRFQPITVSSADAERVRALLEEAALPMDRVRVFEAESDDVWARDHGPITVLRDRRAVMLDFTFNGWGGKFAADLDNRLTRHLHAQGAFPGYELETVALVLEGGAIEVDDAGTLLTTSRCLLAPSRNPHLDRAGIEAALTRLFGVARVLWLHHGNLLGDDTDGHIDTLARFCGADTIAYQGCADPGDAHYDLLQPMAAELRALRTTASEPYRLVELPLPRALLDGDGRRLPAGYANFLIINGAVLMPTYDDPADREALHLLQGCFPDRQVVGVDCRGLIQQYGSLHCVTMQLPALPQ